MRPAFWILTSCTLSGALAQPTPDTLHWSAARPLQPSDFRMEPQAYTGLAGESFCLLAANFAKPHAFARTNFVVTASFDRAKSWIDPKAEQGDLLRYFQVLFDLGELQARRLKQELVEHAPKLDPTQFMQDRYNSAMNAMLEEQVRFRKESRMGMDTAVVEQWYARVRAEIGELPPTNGP